MLYACFVFARSLLDRINGVPPFTRWRWLDELARPANIYNCSMFAWCLLRVGYGLCMLHICLMFARRLLDRGNGVLYSVNTIQQTSSKFPANVEQLAREMISWPRAWNSSYLHSVLKKHFEHYRLSLKEMSTNFNNFWYKYFWRN